MSKILVIDDEESIRTMMRMALELDGHEVLTAADGPEGLEMFRNESPDIVLLDVKMPGMDGLEVLDRLKEIRKESEVIVITGHGDMEMAVECLRKEASNFLTKPLNDELLTLALRRSEEKLALRRKLRQYTENLEELVREANFQLERAYQFRENLIENSPDAIIGIRKGGEIVIFNSEAEKLLGYRKSDVIGKMHITEIYQPGQAKEIMRDLRSDEYGGRGSLKKREMVMRDSRGEEIPVYISAAILYENGVETGSVGVFTDLRERKELEQQLLRTEKLSSLGKLSAGIAHEINQPLTGVLTFASLLKKRFREDESARGDLEVIVRETSRIRDIVQGILEFARETPVKKSSVNIEDVIDRTLEIIVHQEKFFGIELVKDYNGDLPQVVADDNRIQQVILNIILNAVDAMDRAGTLTIRTRTADDSVEIDIQDTGRGMAPEIVDKIFDPFFTTKDSSEGTGMGLGLAVSYGIVKNHAGDINVTSEPGKGSTFTMRLPRAEN